MKTEKELIAKFMGSVPSKDYGVCGWKTYWINQNDPQPTDVRDMLYDTSWDCLMPVLTNLLNKLRLENWATRESHEWAEVYKNHIEKRLFDYIYDDNTSQSDLVKEISLAIKWYNSTQAGK